MKGSLFRRGATAASVAALALTALVATAGAVDDTKPSPCVGGLTVKDPAGDLAAVTPAATPEASDILTFFSKFDPAKGAEAATFNFHVKNLALQVPSGWSSLTWQVIYTHPDGSNQFVRAVLDFSGSVSYEYGTFQNVGGVTNTSPYGGATTGKVFEGADGVIQIVVPADRGGAAANKLTNVFAEARIGRQLPNAFTTPTRGLANTLDTAPDSGEEAGLSVNQIPCETGDPGGGGTGGGSGGGGAGGGGGSGGGGGGGSTPPPPTGGQPTNDRVLPVSLVTKTVKAKKSKKAMKLKLRSTEKVTNLAAQLRRGKKVAGKGKLAQLNGNGTLTIRRPKGLKRGTYILDLVGNDAQGARRFVSYKVRVK